MKKETKIELIHTVVMALLMLCALIFIFRNIIYYGPNEQILLQVLPPSLFLSSVIIYYLLINKENKTKK